MNYIKNNGKRKVLEVHVIPYYSHFKGRLDITYQHTINSKKSHFFIKKEDGSLFMKKCSKCDLWKKPQQMKKDRNTKYGVASYCSKCHAKWKKNYKKTNKDKFDESRKKYYESHKEYILNRCKKWREDNRDHLRKRYEEKGDHIRQLVREYYQKNKEKINKHNHDRYCIRRGVKFEVSGSEAMKAFYKKFGVVCGLTGLPLNIWHIEHLLPIAKGGGNLWCNLYPAEASLNTSKQDRNVFEWIKWRNDIDFTFFFKYTLPYLAEHKGLTVDEFTDWYNSTYENHIDQISSQQNTPSNTEELPLQEAFLF